MKLRSILRVLSLLAFLSACVAGYLYYRSLKEYAFQEAQRIKQYHLETRNKVYEIQQQIFELNEKIKQLMQESYTQRRP